MEIKSIPFDPNEKGILLLSGISEREAVEMIEKLREWIASQEPKIVIYSGNPEVSIEFIRIGQVEDIEVG